jgi:hypothetical protein
MAINHADGTTLGALICCPIVAGVAAASAQAGWFTVVFVAAGLAVGVAVAYAVRKVAYLTLEAALSVKTRPWGGWVFGVAYIILPSAVMASGGISTWLGTLWLVRHVL